MKQLKFHRKYVPDIVSGEKTKTFRYDDDKNLSPGDDVMFQTPDGDVFGAARIGKTVEQMLSCFNSAHWFEGHTSANSAEELKKGLNTYYDEYIHDGSMVKLVNFKVYSIAGDHPYVPPEIDTAPAVETDGTNKDADQQEDNMSQPRFWEELQEHGEVEVELENDITVELHKDAELNDGYIEFTDPDGEEHHLRADSVINFSTHPSHIVE